MIIYKHPHFSSLSGNAVSLYNALVWLAGEKKRSAGLALGFKDISPNAKLAENQFYPARKELVKYGLISYESRGGRNKSLYTLLDLELDINLDSESDLNADKPKARKSAPQVEKQEAPITGNTGKNTAKNLALNEDENRKLQLLLKNAKNSFNF